jgi:hypothetical protein
VQTSMTRTFPRPKAGAIDDIEREDNLSGLEPDDNLAAFHAIVRHLVADGDRRAAATGHRAPRTLDAMRDRLPLPTPLNRRAPRTHHAAHSASAIASPESNDACPICGFWRCHCVKPEAVTG